MTAPCDKCGHTHSTSLGGICVGCPCPEGGWNSPAPEPLGPALAAELGGEWDEKCEWVRLPEHVIWETVLGLVLMQKVGSAERIRLGSHSDGVEALAAKAREMGAA